jgi:16S rRNA (adenine1518-N6/adenine1519-N6)-dimethyltransferase
LPLTEITRETASLKVAGNIPYNITTPILFHLLKRQWRPAHIVLMVQKEVAERISAAPGEEAYGALSIGVQSISSVERLFNVSRNSFRPVPNVDSTVIRITPFRPFPLSEQEEADLRALTQTAFGWRRKQLQRTLRSSPAYQLALDQVIDIQTETGIQLERRPESLSIDEILLLATALRRAGLPRETS